MTKVAVVEDNPDNRLLVRAILDGQYLISEFETGPDALRAWDDERPDLVLLDISLPGMDGTEVIRRIRRNSALHGLPVVALTAHAMAGDREKFLGQGFDEYIAKPITDDDLLLDAIRRLLQGKGH